MVPLLRTISTYCCPSVPLVLSISAMLAACRSSLQSRASPIANRVLLSNHRWAAASLFSSGVLPTAPADAIGDERPAASTAVCPQPASSPPSPQPPSPTTSAADTRLRALSLYRQLLRGAERMPTPNRRNYVMRKTRSEYRRHAALVDGEEIEFQLRLADTNLDTVLVQAEHLSRRVRFRVCARGCFFGKIRLTSDFRRPSSSRSLCSFRIQIIPRS